MERFSLNAQPRQADADIDVLRAESRIPGVVYGGARTEALSLSVDRSDLIQAIKHATPSTVIDLAIEGESAAVPVLIQEVQQHPVNDEYLSIDFRQVELGKPVKAFIPLNFIGESPALKMGGMLVVNRESMRVKGLPEALIGSIDVDLSQIQDFTDSIRIRDLALPEGVELLDDATASVAVIRQPKKSKADKAADAAVAAAAPAEGEAAGEEAKAE